VAASPIEASTDHACHQKPNPSLKTVPLNFGYFVMGSAYSFILFTPLTRTVSDIFEWIFCKLFITILFLRAFFLSSFVHIRYSIHDVNNLIHFYIHTDFSAWFCNLLSIFLSTGNPDCHINWNVIKHNALVSFSQDNDYFLTDF
jgi:hypothetical protein